ncbi:MAG TPA: SdpI family protein [Rhodanobacteraceae bacterium]|nr:SdpI family protein [Rhodanobacteraceae bacterium]
MKSLRSWIVSGVFVLIAVVAGVWLYPRLPASVPTHWDLEGHANGWSPRWFAVALWPASIAFMAILAWLLPVISPRKFEITPFADVYRGLMLVVQAFLLVVGVCVMLAGTGQHVPITKVTLLGAGVLLMVIGNYMGKLRKNFFIGIRSPWTLASDATWARTHRFAGWLFVFAGAAWVAVSLTAAGRHVWPLVVIFVVVACVPYAYSYVVYRRVVKSGKPEGESE